MAWQEQSHTTEIDLGLERVSAVFQRLKTHSHAPKYTITVAGTNGKGSCVALFESILIAAGYRVGVYSTPHLTRYNERVRINGEPVSNDLLTQAFEQIDLARTDISLSYFEFGTLAALTIFADQSTDIQILEVGLGGRLDAVNIVDANAVLISSISVDHIDWLGDDLNKIALEKSGVFRTKQQAVCGDENVPKSLLHHASELGTDLLLAGKDFSISIRKEGWNLNAQHSLRGSYPLPGLKGVHQIQNAAAVISLLAHISTDILVSKAAITAGLQHVALKGRLQQVNSHPDVFLDVAHNAESAGALAKFINETSYTGQLHAVFSILADKQVAEVVEPFKDLVDQWYIAPLSSKRSESVESLDTLLSNHSSRKCSQYDSIQEAFKSALKRAGDEDIVICFGSFFVVEACLEAL